MSAQTPVTPGVAAKWTVLAFVILGLTAMTLVGGAAGCSAYNRYQNRANLNQTRQQRLLNEKNLTTVNDIKISQTKQLVKVAAQQAKIRAAQALGIRKAQNIISATLTPLYVQFEEIQALQDIAKSGRNSSVIFIPTGSDGRPIVSQQMNPIHPSGGTP